MSMSLKLMVGGNSCIYSYGNTNGKVALKVVAQGSKEAIHLRNQWELLRSVSHANIVRTLKYNENASLQNFNGKKSSSQLRLARNVLVLEWAQQGSLLDYLRKQSPEVACLRNHFTTICTALQHLHSLCIAHRDLKLENVLVFVEDGVDVAKLADFGLASKCEENGKPALAKGFKGTLRGYMAPEIYACQSNPQQKYDAFKSDIFALGVILFALMFKKMPFEYAKSENSLYKLIVEGKKEQFWSHFEVDSAALRKDCMMDDFKDLFMQCVDSEPSKRPSIEEVLAAEWLKGNKN